MQRPETRDTLIGENTAFLTHADFHKTVRLFFKQRPSGVAYRIDRTMKTAWKGHDCDH